jgi:uncharacterized protein (DUF362 family)
MASRVAIARKEVVPPISINYTPEDVKIVQSIVEEAINLLGGIEKFVPRGSRVIIKPNCVFLEDPQIACNTDPRVVESVVNVVKKTNPQRIVISEWQRAAGPALWEVSGMNKVVRNTGAEIVASENDKLIEREIPGAVGLLSSKGIPLVKATIPKSYADADVFINIPKLKTHVCNVATLSLKNMLGVPPCHGPGSYLDYHNDNIHQAIVEYYKAVKPDLNIIDGIVALEGQSPYLSLDTVDDMNVIIAGVDGVAVDAVGSSVMGIHPYEVASTRLAWQQGIGEADLGKIEVVGKQISEVQRHFRRALPDIIGYQRYDDLKYPIETFLGGTCIPGCYCMTREACDMLALAAYKYDVPQEKRRKLYIIIGAQARYPKDLAERIKKENSMLYVIGDCAKEHAPLVKSLGKNAKFYGGCCCDWVPLYVEICPDCIGRRSIEHGEGLISGIDPDRLRKLPTRNTEASSKRL